MRALGLTLVLLLSAACGGGGGGGGGGSVAPPPPPPVDSKPGGLWFGTLAYEDQTFEEVIAITTDDGRFIFISLDTFGPDTFGQYVGTVTVSGSDLAGSGSAYAAQGSTWNDGSTVRDISLTATIDERTGISGQWTIAGGESVSFQLEYDLAFEKDSSLALLAGVWYVYDDTLNPILTLTAESDGSFSGQDAMGCVSLGQISIIDTGTDVYGWDVAITSCAMAGDYSGLAVLFDIQTDDPDNSSNNAVLVSISNDQRALLLPLER